MTDKNDHTSSALEWDAPWQGDRSARPSTGHGLNYEEGLGWDTDVPNEFLLGVRQAYGEADAGKSQVPGHFGPDKPPRPNQNLNVFEKPVKETMRERAHVGSASWVEAPAQLGAFVRGAGDAETDRNGDYPYAHEHRDGGHYSRPSPARIED